MKIYHKKNFAVGLGLSLLGAANRYGQYFFIVNIREFTPWINSMVVAGIVGAAGAPFAAQWLVAQGGIGLVGLYLAAAAGLSFAAVLAMPETGGRLRGGVAMHEEHSGQ